MTKPQKIKLFASGRLCLFGEHSDWAGQARAMNAEVEPGRAIVTGIEQGIYAEAYRSENFVLIDKVSGIGENSFSCQMNREKLKEAAHQGGYYSYVCGVASYMCEWYRVGGITVEIYDQDLPIQSGLSSSAAVCVLIARAFNQLYDLHLNTEGIMNIAYWGEQRTPSRCGRLDQACAYGVAPVAMTFDGHEVDVERIPVRANLYYVFADLMAGKDTVRILADLNRGFPFASNDMEKREHEALGKDNLEITERAMKYISSGDAEKLGELMVAAQDLFDRKVAPMCPQELTSPVLHETLKDPEIQKYTYGGKGVGSQGDGTVQFLSKNEECQQKLFDYLTETKGMTAYKLTLRPNSTVKKAIIPVAGFGTRLYPATRGIRKEFCPVLDRDGLMKPVILVLLEELDEAGIEEICFIINPEERRFYEDFFKKPLALEHYENLAEEMKQYEEKFRRISDKVRFVLQTEQKGFGHAVYQARDFAGDDPVMLLLGDTIYISNTDVPCTKQLMQAFDTYGKPIVAVHEVPLSDVSSYGIFAGAWEDQGRTVMNLDRIEEKPSPQYAEDYLGMKKGSGNKRSYMAAFGIYILTKDVFSELAAMCRENEESRSKDEVELTVALSHVMRSSGMLAFLPNGESFDMGNVRAYQETFCYYAERNGDRKKEPKPYHIGYVAGAFDMFHIGHLNLLRRAKERCDHLIVGVISDERMYELKKKYPIIPCNERMQVVRGCRYADQVEELPFGDAGIMDAYNRFHFDCMFSGDDHATDPGWLAERERLQEVGSDIQFVSYTKETSSSMIREKMSR
ncbi:MAG: adenylyltransferase/cytidyltransferase family protein [Lachnospiraceae bacterium]|nr:adenylyltransferase/cytidyltransferase family protein [Lachnospiraceae bacterium]